MGALTPIDPGLPPIVSPKRTVPALADTVMQFKLADLNQLKQMVTFVQRGGKLAAWSLVGTGIGFSLALLLASVHVALLGLSGALLGTGIYGTRLFQIYKHPSINELQEKLRGLQQMLDAKLITGSEYDEMRKRVIKSAKV